VWSSNAVHAFVSEKGPSTNPPTRCEVVSKTWRQNGIPPCTKKVRVYFPRETERIKDSKKGGHRGAGH